jgi:hypothetical protein
VITTCALTDGVDYVLVVALALTSASHKPLKYASVLADRVSEAVGVRVEVLSESGVPTCAVLDRANGLTGMAQSE